VAFSDNIPAKKEETIDASIENSNQSWFDDENLKPFAGIDDSLDLEELKVEDQVVIQDDDEDFVL